MGGSKMVQSMVYVTTAVPVASLAEFHSAVAEILAVSGSGTASAADVGGATSEREERDMSEVVREAYLGGDSRVQRPFLHLLAQRAGEWVPSEDVIEEIDRTPAQYRGAMGAFERRLGTDSLPYEKRWHGDRRWYRMSAEVAEMVTELRAHEEGEDA
jgi:hypothetical protein